jgi:hypothetical protein
MADTDQDTLLKSQIALRLNTNRLDDPRVVAEFNRQKGGTPTASPAANAPTKPMADQTDQTGAPPTKPKFARIPGLLPENEQETVAADNQSMRQAMRQQLGTHVGYKTLGNTQWEVRDIGSAGHPYHVYAAPDPQDPNRVQVWDYNMQRDPPPSVPIGGPNLGQQVQDLRNEMSRKYGGMNPITNKPWNPLLASYGDLQSMKRYSQVYEGYQPASPEMVNDLTKGNYTADLLRDIQNRYQTLGGRQGLNNLRQMFSNVRTDSQWDTWLGMVTGNKAINTGDKDRDNYLLMLRDLANLQKEGQNIGKISQGGTAGSVIDSVNDILGGVGITKPFMSAGIGGALSLLKKVADGTFQPDAVSTLAPEAEQRINQVLYNQVSNAVSPSGRILLDQNMRQIGNKAAERMEAAGLGPGDSVPETVGREQEPQQSGEKPAGGGGPPPTATSIPGAVANKPADQAPQTPHELIEQERKAGGEAVKRTVEGAIKGAQSQPQGQQEPVTTTPGLVPLPQGSETIQGPGSIVNAPLGQTPAVTQQPQTPAAAQTDQRGTPLPQTLWNVGQGLISPGGPATLIRAPAATGPTEHLEQTIPKVLNKLINPFYDPATDREWQMKMLQGATTQAEPVGSNVEVGAPLGAGDAPGVTRLHQQEHVDALEPGTPFYWRDHPNAYVRV